MKPRRIILLAVLVALIVYRAWHYDHARRRSVEFVPAPAMMNSPAMRVWPYFDRLAALRDAPDAQFQPALAALRSAAAAVPEPNLKANADVLSNISGCTTWLLFYRHAILSKPPDMGWKQRSEPHVNSCVREHVDHSD